MKQEAIDFITEAIREYDKDGNYYVPEYCGTTVTKFNKNEEKVSEIYFDDDTGMVIGKVDFDTNGLKTAEYDILGNKTEYKYDENGTVVETKTTKKDDELNL